MEWKSETYSKSLYRQSRKMNSGLYVNNHNMLNSYVFRNNMFEKVNLDTICDTGVNIFYDNQNTFVFPYEDDRSAQVFSEELQTLRRHNALFSSSQCLMCLKCVSAEYVSKDLLLVNLLGVVFLTDFKKSMRRFQNVKHFSSSSLLNILELHKDAFFLEGLCRFPQERDDLLFKGVGKKMVEFCIVEAKKQKKDIFLTVFDYASNHKIHKSHEHLIHYYYTLGFREICKIRHLYSDILYTLMHLDSKF